jgi:hypothetical protein
MAATIENPKIAIRATRGAMPPIVDLLGIPIKTIAAADNNQNGHTTTLEPYLSAIIPASGAEINVGMTLAIKINPI